MKAEILSIWKDINALRVGFGLADDDVPANAITVEQWVKQYGVSRSTAEREINRLVSGKALKCGKKRIRLANRSVLSNHYWPTGIEK